MRSDSALDERVERRNPSAAQPAISDFPARTGCLPHSSASDAGTPRLIVGEICPRKSPTVQWIPVQKEGSDEGIIVDTLPTYLVLSIT